MIVYYKLLKEDGDYLLLETGDFILLENYLLVDQTIQAKGYISFPTAQSIQAKASIKIFEVGKTAQSKANIKNTLVKNIQAKANIKIVGVLRSIQAKGRIKTIDIGKSIQAKASIKISDIGRAIQAKANILNFVLVSVQAKARIKTAGVLKTIQAKARIETIGIGKDIQAKANILNFVSSSIQAKASIKIFNVLKTLQAKARIQTIGIGKTIQAKANILHFIPTSIQAKANIKNAVIAIIQAKARIKVIDVLTSIQAKARIQTIGVGKTVQVKANILNAVPVTISAKANIRNAVSKSITAKARIQVINVYKTVLAKARIQATARPSVTAKAKIISPINNIKLSYKLYQPNGTFITEVTNDVISDFQINKTINGGVGSLDVTLARTIDDYDEYDAVKNPTGAIKYNNRLKVFLTDRYNTEKLIFYGYLVEIAPSFTNGREKVEISFYGAVSKLSNDYYNNSGTPPYEPTEPAGFYVVETAVSASTIIKNVLDNFASKVSLPMVTYTLGVSLVDCSNIVSYTFDRQTYLDSLKKSEEYLPVGWYWYVDGTGLMNVKNSAVQTNHKLTIGRHIQEIQAHKTIDSVINYFILWNGKSTADAAYVFAYKNDPTSQAAYDRRILFQQDSDIVEDSVATIRKDKVIAYRKDPKNKLTVQVSGKYYDLASFEPGQLVSIRNIRDDRQTTFADGMIINRISYKVDSALLELGEIGADLVSATSDEQTAIELSIKQAQSAIQDLQSGVTPITDVNIWSNGVQFIEDTVVYSPIIAGVNGYFKESIRLGDSGVGAVIRSYGKAAFNNNVAGFWLEKSATEQVYFELFYDAANYLRFNTFTHKLEVGGDIVMSAGSSITWAQVSGAGKPADNATVNAIFNQAAIPTSLAIGDLWIDSDDKNKLYRAFSVGATTVASGKWQIARDTDIPQALSDAADALTAANNAQGDADTALASLADIASDSKVTPNEKLTAKQLWDAIVVEGTASTGTLPVEAASLSVSDANFDTAYAALNTYLNTTITVFANMTTTTTVVRATWDTKWKDYYNQRTLLINAIATAASLRAAWANISDIPWTAKATYITQTKITATTIESPTITAGTITGTVVQNVVTARTGVKMSQALGGIVIYDQSLYIKNGNDDTIGYLYPNYAGTPQNSGSNWRLGLVNYSGIDTFIGAGTNIILSAEFVIPANDNTVSLGASTTIAGGQRAYDWTWKYIGGQTIDAKTEYRINNIVCIGAVISGTYQGVYFTGNNSIHLQGSQGTDDIKCTSSRVDIYHDIYVSGSIYVSGVVEMGTGRIRVGGTDFYVRSDPNSPGNYYLRT